MDLAAAAVPDGEAIARDEDLQSSVHTLAAKAKLVASMSTSTHRSGVQSVIIRHHFATNAGSDVRQWQ